MRAQTSTWLRMADEDWSAARVLLDAGLRRSTVFHVHLAVEKTLKALVWEETGVQPPFTHDLRRLTLIANLAPPAPLAVFLVNLSRRVGARYEEQPIFTDQFCRDLLIQAEEVLLWLRQRLT